MQGVVGEWCAKLILQPSVRLYDVIHHVTYWGSWRRFHTDFPFLCFLPCAAAIIVIIIIYFHPVLSSQSKNGCCIFQNLGVYQRKGLASFMKEEVKLGKIDREMRLSARWGSVSWQDTLFCWRNRIWLGQLFLMGSAVVKYSWLRYLFVSVFGINARIFQCPNHLGLR